MSAADLIAEAHAAGVRLHLVDGGRLRWTCAAPPPADLLARLRENKPLLIRALEAIGHRVDRGRGGGDSDLAATWRAENPLDANGPTDPCVHCGEHMTPEDRTPVLALGGHAWMHRECWPAMNAARQQQALDAVRALLGATP